MGDYDMTAGPSKNNHSIPNTQLCKEQNCDGFDLNMGSNWIYPTNKPLRSYQHNIIQKCLYNNTLVVLPTGLGKTFIAAVIIYNYYRWYPRGKIIFVAPTKPLVFQQKTACFDIMGISDVDTAEITGQLSKDKRSELWKSKRLFFATPQVVENDLDLINFPSSSIKLIIFDEAHKAKGKYAYCEIVRKMNKPNRFFRVLALSATPGRNVADVVDVVKNLLISHIELRHIDSPDIATYLHKTNIVSEVVELGEDLEIYKTNFINIIRPYVDNLRNANAIVGQTETLSKNWLIMQHKHFCENSRNNYNYKEINADFSLCTILYHGLELLVRNGLKVFQNFFMEDNQKLYFCFQRDARLTAFLDEIKCTINLKGETYFGHPKFDILRNTLLCHFSNHENSKVIVFCEYRFCVSLILNRLKNCSFIKPKALVGQSKNTTQKTQRETLNEFKAGLCNVLISTSVGEEGLDIGEVDLIVCFDINTKNSSRFVQRIGRTGRKRSGDVVMLVTKGKEDDNLKEALKNQNKTNNIILNSKAITDSLFQLSHRLVPIQFNPICLETYMSPNLRSEPSKSSKKTKKNITNYFNKIPVKEEEQEKVIVEILKNEAPIVISDDEDLEPNLSKISNKDKSLQKICLFEKRLDQNKFYSSYVKDGKNKFNHCTKRYALIDVTNLISDVEQIQEDIQTLKVEQIHIEREKLDLRIHQSEDDNSFSQNISYFLNPEANFSTDKMNVTQLSTWSSPPSSDRFDLYVNTVDDLFEESWKSEGSLGNLKHWKNSSPLTTDNLKQPIEEKNDITDILSQSVLNLSSQHQTLELNENNDNEDREDYTVCPKTPEHLKQYILSPEISPSIFDVKRRRRRSSTELLKEDIESDDNLKQPIEEKNDITDILSQSVLNLSSQHQTLELHENNDNEDKEDYTVCPKTPEHLKQYTLSPEISPSIFEVKRRRRCLDTVNVDGNLETSSTELSRQDIESDENDTQILHELNSTFNDLETIESSQQFLVPNRPRLRRLLFENNKKSPKKCDSKIKFTENIMSSSLKNQSEIAFNISEKESNQNSVQPEKQNSFSSNNKFSEMEQSNATDDEQTKNVQRTRNYKKNIFINDQAIDSSEDPDEETEPNDLHLPDDSVIDNTFDESAFTSTVDMTKMYLESVKWPINKGFKTPFQHSTCMTDVFSQTVLPEDSILEDSFINDSIQLNDEEDEIDRAEAILKERSKKRKRRLVETSVVKLVKKRRYYMVSSDSSQDS